MTHLNVSLGIIPTFARYRLYSRVIEFHFDDRIVSKKTLTLVLNKTLGFFEPCANDSEPLETLFSTAKESQNHFGWTKVIWFPYYTLLFVYIFYLFSRI